jgi:two-component system alkaline phosphatase synthesis response regulator PhoP
MAAPLILLVDDEPGILQLGRLYLERAGFRVVQAEDGEAAIKIAESQEPSLIVLDVMLPTVDGFEVCRRLRDAENGVAILMLTARDDDIDKIIGLELGADDYLTKPFNPRELVARAKAILRRSSAGGRDEGSIQVGDLSMDLARREVLVGKRSTDLRAQEFDLLAVLAGQPGRVFTREQLLRQAWGIEFYGQTRTVDVHVAQLRKKLAGAAVHIETVTGVGYKLLAGASQP